MMMEEKELKEIDPEKSLVYSMGALFSNIYKQKTYEEKLAKKSRGILSIRKNNLIEFISQMKAEDPEMRPTFEKVSSFKWAT